jgi:hypothetical protein
LNVDVEGGRVVRGCFMVALVERCVWDGLVGDIWVGRVGLERLGDAGTRPIVRDYSSPSILVYIVEIMKKKTYCSWCFVGRNETRALGSSRTSR